MSQPTHTNRLIHETSPYLLQHAHNPVDWFAWGDEAFQKAREEDKPMFLSIGYSACHWCHVMERESFESEEIAELLNRDFVAIKVDREERPDVDSIYMQAVQMMTGHGGWPMSMFLVPDGTPFFGGTYFPPDDGRGMPGFKRVLRHVVEIYREHPEQVSEAGDAIRKALGQVLTVEGGDVEIRHENLDDAAEKVSRTYDRIHGGFGGAPKFPPAMTLEFLSRAAWRSGSEPLRQIVLVTLRKMAAGGIYDQIGGGFHRYSVDARWLAPHFEKMLYDNALLTSIYLHAWQWTKDPEFERIVRETLDFIIREMTAPDGGFYSTLDADSEGEEGKFYVWSRAEVLEVLGAENGRIFSALYDITERGNWEGHNIPNLPRAPRDVASDLGISEEDLSRVAASSREVLFQRRASRIRPARDEKVLAGWNGWMLASFAEAALAFDSPAYLDIVRRNADFLCDTMMAGVRILRSFKDGRVRIAGLLEDYAGVAWGLIAAFEATQSLRYLETARSLANQILERFADDTHGGFFDTPIDHEKLITRPKDLFDNATPAGNSLAVASLQKLALYLSDETFERAAREAIRAIGPVALRYPSGFGFLLGAAEWMLGRPKEIAITGEACAERDELVRAVATEFVPHKIFVWSPAPLPLTENKPADRLMAYVCEGYNCLAPTSDPNELRKQLAAP